MSLPGRLFFMAEILTEQIEAIKVRQRDFQQMPIPTSQSNPSTEKTGEDKKDPKQGLPKGVVLDKDGKPSVSQYLIRFACGSLTQMYMWR